MLSAVVFQAIIIAFVFGTMACIDNEWPAAKVVVSIAFGSLHVFGEVLYTFAISLLGFIGLAHATAQPGNLVVALLEWVAVPNFIGTIILISVLGKMFDGGKTLDGLILKLSLSNRMVIAAVILLLDLVCNCFEAWIMCG
jgi:hypothetical protein